MDRHRFSRPARRPLAFAGTVLIVMVLLTAACAGRDRSSAATPAATTEQSAAAPSDTPAPNFTAKLSFDPSYAVPGTTVQFAGAGYQSKATVELVWHTVSGRYELEQGTEFIGQRFDEVLEVLVTAEADATGNIRGSFEVPVDYGGPHDVRGRVDGVEISQANLTISPTFSLSPAEGPVGTLIELRITGVDYRTNINTWHVLYNNDYLGFMSGVTTKGIAVGRFRAAGPVGNAQISVWHNSYNSIPYLNWPQGPYKDVPGADFVFTVTEDSGVDAVQIEDFSDTDNPWPVPSDGPGTLSLSADRGQVGEETTLQGSGLPPNSELTLRWWTMVGNRVSSIGFDEQPSDLGTVQTDDSGAFTKVMPIPDDLGGHHRIEVADGDQVLAAAGLVIQPSVVSVTPTEVRAGEQIQIHLKGVGWTTYDNTYAVTYDNSYIGYVCGFSTNGDVQFLITATGAPGTHIIDLYPTIYKGEEPRPRVYSVPQLTYATDHPQRTTPAIRLAIEIVD